MKTEHLETLMSEGTDKINELRDERDRLKAINAELVEALGTMILACIELDEYIRAGIIDNQQRRADEAIGQARAAIAKAKQ